MHILIITKLNGPIGGMNIKKRIQYSDFITKPTTQYKAPNLRHNIKNVEWRRIVGVADISDDLYDFDCPNWWILSQYIVVYSNDNVRFLLGYERTQNQSFKQKMAHIELKLVHYCNK